MGAVIGCILIFGFIACLWIRTWNLDVKPQVQQHQRMQMYSSARYDKETLTLHLFRKGEDFVKLIKIKDDRNLEIDYKPLQLHVGAVTVGGVTTGGSYTTGGHYYVSGERKNGLCRLEYTGCLVARIQLSDALYANAKNSSIAKYLNDKKQIEVIKPKAVTLSEQQLALKLLETTGYVGNDYAKNGYPKYEKCKEIMDWITSTN